MLDFMKLSNTQLKFKTLLEKKHKSTERNQLSTGTKCLFSDTVISRFSQDISEVTFICGFRTRIVQYTVNHMYQTQNLYL